MIRAALNTLLLIFWGTLATNAVAETVEQRLERLERKVEHILELLERRQAADIMPPAEPIGAKGDAREHVPQPAIQPAIHQQALGNAAQQGVYIEYHLAKNSQGAFPPAGDPMARGVINFDGTLSFDPAVYDLPRGRWFSEYTNPAQYKSAAVLLRAEFLAGDDGKYEFVMYPKPARQGGSPVSATMTIQFWIDERKVLAVPVTKSWKPHRLVVDLKQGKHDIRLWAESYSPGFGVGTAATESSLELAVKGPRDASSQPLKALYAVQPD